MKVAIGYDVNEYYAQISYVTEGTEPETLQFVFRNEEGNVETALCKRNGVNQWFCGKEAVKKGVSGEGVLIEHLWSLLSEKETIRIEKQEYEVVQLCNLFLSKTLSWAIQQLEEICQESVEVEALVLTSDPWNEEILRKMDVLLQNLPVSREKIFFQGHEESLFSYLVHQPQRLLGYETGVFDLTGETLVSYRIEMNHKTRPIVTTVHKEVVSDIVRKKHYASIMEHDRQLEQLDQKLMWYAQDFIKGRIVTGLYLIGEGFQGEWYRESLKVLCRNRKVFAGNNIFSKGACYSAFERVWRTQVSEDFVFFGKDMLRYNIGLSMWNADTEEYYPLLDAGTKWYDADASVTFMMEDADTIELKIMPIDGKGMYIHKLQLENLPTRPFRSYRMSLTADMESACGLKICVRDEGFGEIYEKIPVDMEFRVMLGEDKIDE